MNYIYMNKTALKKEKIYFKMVKRVNTDLDENLVLIFKTV